MSARGAEGILRASGKLPAPPKPLNAPPDAPPEDSTQPPNPPEDAQKPESPARSVSPRAGGSAKASKAGSAVGQAIGRPIGSGLSMGNEAAGFILGLMVWGWVVRPYLQKGLPGVKAVLMAKFFNKKPDGSDLP